MTLDWTSFNLLEFVAAFILALTLWLFEKIFVKPRIIVRTGTISNLSGGKLKTLNLSVSNEKRGGLLGILNKTATQIRVNIRFLDFQSRVEFNNVVARWNNSKEPVTPDYQGVDIGLALTNPREVLVPGQSEEISVVIKKDGDASCYPFNNESYIFYKQDYLKSQWEIKDDKFLVVVEFQSGELYESIAEFVVLNKSTLNQFKLSQVA